jgi:hypothetical protein
VNLGLVEALDKFEGCREYNNSVNSPINRIEEPLNSL